MISTEPNHRNVSKFTQASAEVTLHIPSPTTDSPCLLLSLASSSLPLMNKMIYALVSSWKVETLSYASKWYFKFKSSGTKVYFLVAFQICSIWNFWMSCVFNSSSKFSSSETEFYCCGWMLRSVSYFWLTYIIPRYAYPFNSLLYIFYTAFYLDIFSELHRIWCNKMLFSGILQFWW